MKQTLIFLVSLVFLFSCDKDSVNSSSSVLGGDSDLSMNEVGNGFYGSLYVNGSYVSTNEDIEVIENDNGVVTLHISAAIPSSLPFASLIPENLKDSYGNLDTEVKYKNTSEGILDYTNIDGEPFVIVRYDDNVGDTYTLKKSDGKTITRTVISKSTTDDYTWGYMYIKTIAVEQDSRIPGVDRIVYQANHKFGLVGIEVFMEDGTSTKMSLYSYN
jgi:hypothetical protein